MGSIEIRNGVRISTLDINESLKERAGGSRVRARRIPRCAARVKFVTFLISQSFAPERRQLGIRAALFAVRSPLSLSLGFYFVVVLRPVEHAARDLSCSQFVKASLHLFPVICKKSRSRSSLFLALAVNARGE